MQYCCMMANTAKKKKKEEEDKIAKTLCHQVGIVAQTEHFSGV